MNDELLPLSYINQWAYCPRRFWYMFVQGEMAVNVHVLAGILDHENVDTPGFRTAEGGAVQYRRVFVLSDRLGISGICDLVEVSPTGDLLPIEYKQGQRGRWGNDHAQLCAQALCLEEMTGRPVPVGEIFYFGDRRREHVVFSPELRAATTAIVAAMRLAVAHDELPPHTDLRARCHGCSLADHCLPDETRCLTGAPDADSPRKRTGKTP